MKALNVLTVALALMGYACGNQMRPVTPVSPNPTLTLNPTTAPRSTAPDRIPPGDLWRLSTTIVSLEGAACFWTRPVGAKNDDWTLSVERNNGEVRFVYDVFNPDDNLRFVGSVNERAFTAVSNSYSSSWRCAPRVSFSSSVTGSFSSDGRSLSGRERLTYRVDGGGELTITYEWSATML